MARVVIGTHEEHLSPEEYRLRVKRLFCQRSRTMVDIIMNKDKDGQGGVHG